MSEFIRTLNLIKARRDIEWLTPSQVKALAALKEALRAPGTVNLCSPAGAGKTFLTWVLADDLGYAYFPHLKHFTQAEEIRASGVIIDNGKPDRQSHRNALKALQFQNMTRAVLVTRELIRDYTHYVELSLSLEDQEKVRHNLASVGHITPDAKAFNLWYLINPYL